MYKKQKTCKYVIEVSFALEHVVEEEKDCMTNCADSAQLSKKASKKESEWFVSLSLSSLRQTVKAKSHLMQYSTSGRLASKKC